MARKEEEGGEVCMDMYLKVRRRIQLFHRIDAMKSKRMRLFLHEYRCDA